MRSPTFSTISIIFIFYTFFVLGACLLFKESVNTIIMIYCITSLIMCIYLTYTTIEVMYLSNKLDQNLNEFIELDINSDNLTNAISILKSMQSMIERLLANDLLVIGDYRKALIGCLSSIDQYIAELEDYAIYR